MDRRLLVRNDYCDCRLDFLTLVICHSPPSGEKSISQVANLHPRLSPQRVGMKARSRQMARHARVGHHHRPLRVELAFSPAARGWWPSERGSGTVTIFAMASAGKGNQPPFLRRPCGMWASEPPSPRGPPNSSHTSVINSWTIDLHAT